MAGGEPTFCSMVLFVWLDVKEDGGGRKTNLYDVEMSYAVCTRILVYSIWFLVL